jgi:hypothetical protein
LSRVLSCIWINWKNGALVGVLGSDGYGSHPTRPIRHQPTRPSRVKNPSSRAKRQGESLVDRNELKNSLIARFEEWWLNYWNKRKQYLAELESELRDLELTYGKPAVNQMFTLMRMNGEDPCFPHGAPGAMPETEKPPKTKRRRRSRRTRKANQLSFGDTRQPVLSAVQHLKPGTPFTTKDIEGTLRGQKLNVNSGYVSLVLSSYLDGLEKLGKKAVNPETGRALNLYRFADKDRVRIRHEAEAKNGQARKKK